MIGFVERDRARVKLAVLRVEDWTLPLVGRDLRRMAQNHDRWRAVFGKHGFLGAKLTVAIIEFQLFIFMAAANPNAVDGFDRVGR